MLALAAEGTVLTDSSPIDAGTLALDIGCAVALVMFVVLIVSNLRLLVVVRRGLRQHMLSTVLTVVAVSLGGGLTMAVVSLKNQAYDAFTGGDIGYDAVLGARGSKLQLVLNCVYHLETSPGNISYEVYDAVRKDPRVELAVPYALGDNYFGYRIVGTTTAIFTDLEYQTGKRYEFEQGGRPFDSSRRECVIGSYASQQTGLRVGDTFSPYHGLFFDPNSQHAEEYVVVGVMKPTNTPSDRVLWIPIEGIWRMEGHVLRGVEGVQYTPEAGAEIPDEYKEVSAVMLKLRSPQAGFMLEQQINRQGKDATLAWPIGVTMSELFNKIGWIVQVLAMVSVLVVIVAAMSILASLYNTMNERRREFAILRALGASRFAVSSVIVLESTTIAALGAVLSYGVYVGVLAVASSVVRDQTGVVLEVLQFDPILYWVFGGLVAIGLIAGLIPAIRAYTNDVAAGLTPTS